MSETSDRATLGFDLHDGVFRNPSLWDESDHAHGSVKVAGFIVQHPSGK